VVRKGYIVAGGGLAGVFAALMVFAPMASPDSPQEPAADNGTTVASERPSLMLVLLEGAEDASIGVAKYDPENSGTINLQSNDHVRFESPDIRLPESLRIIAEDKADGHISILRKSYDVNNEFFINLDEGEYQLRAQASWADKGSFVYTYDITVA
jgi:hypothetical protein